MDGWMERERGEGGRERERRRQRGLVTRRRVKRRWEWSGVDEKERRVTMGVWGAEPFQKDEAAFGRTLD